MKVNSGAAPVTSKDLRKDSINKLRSDAGRPSSDLNELAKNFGEDHLGLTGCKEGTDKGKEGRENTAIERFQVSTMAEPRFVGVEGRLGSGRMVCS